MAHDGVKSSCRSYVVKAKISRWKTPDLHSQSRHNSHLAGAPHRLGLHFGSFDFVILGKILVDYPGCWKTGDHPKGQWWLHFFLHHHTCPDPAHLPWLSRLTLKRWSTSIWQENTLEKYILLLKCLLCKSSKSILHFGTAWQQEKYFKSLCVKMPRPAQEGWTGAGGRLTLEKYLRRKISTDYCQHILL